MWVTVEKIVLSIVFSFVLRQLDKFKTGIDWAKVKSDLDERIKKAVPIVWLTPAILALADTLIDDIQKALSAQDQLKKILDLLAANKWEEALVALKDFLLVIWGQAPSAHQIALKHLVK